jgi:hypothetical protein
MAVADIYQIKVFQDMPGQDLILNVFYYAVQAGEDDPDDLLSVFAEEVWDVVRAIQVPSCVTYKYEVINGSNNTVWKEQGVADAGTNIATAPVTPFIAAGFRSSRVFLGSRYSYKRFAGAPSASIDTSDGSWNATMLGKAYDVSVGLGAVLEGDEAFYYPIQITGGFQLGVAPTPKQNVLGQWTFNRFPTHQDTRQPYEWQVLEAP